MLSNQPQSLDRCYALDDILARLARLHPDTKFLRARAGALGFAKSSGPKASAAAVTSRVNRPSRRLAGGLSDDDGDSEGDAERSDEEVDDDDVDTDMLPTMLVYRDGELVHNWVRVDWEAGAAGLVELLERCSFSLARSRRRVILISNFRHHVLAPSALGAFGSLNPLDDENLWASGED